VTHAAFKQKKTHLTAIGISGFFLLIDQFFKYIAYTNPDLRFYMIDPWLGWEYLANPGIAFSLPIPNIFLVWSTPVILFLLCTLFIKKKERGVWYLLATTLILVGATSNFIDRVLFGITIDYIRVAHSVLNIADIMIVGGALALLVQETKKTKRLPHRL